LQGRRVRCWGPGQAIAAQWLARTPQRRRRHCKSFFGFSFTKKAVFDLP
jgi:hypothetical protein